MSSPIIVAVDFHHEKAVYELVDQLDPKNCSLKIGSDLFLQAGVPLIKELQARQFKIMLDLKLYDIPNTVANSVKRIADLGVSMTTLHISGGRKMLQAAKDALYEYGDSAPKLIGITMLSTLTMAEREEVGVSTALEHTMKLATLGKQCGLDGVMCSSKEVQSFRTRLGSDFYLITVGIRPFGIIEDDQTDIMTPKRAMAAGSNALIVGRPMTRSQNPVQVLNNLLSDIAE